MVFCHTYQLQHLLGLLSPLQASKHYPLIERLPDHGLYNVLCTVAPVPLDVVQVAMVAASTVVGTLYGSNPRGHEWCVPEHISLQALISYLHTLNWLLSSNSLFFPRLKNFTFLIYPVTL